MRWKRKQLDDSLPKRPPKTREINYDFAKDKLIQVGEVNVVTANRKLRRDERKALEHLKEHLQKTWHRSYHEAILMQRITLRQIDFAYHYARLGFNHDAKEKAYDLAGYNILHGDTKKREMADKLLAKPNIQKLVKLFEIEQRAKMKLSIEEVVAAFQDIAGKALDVGDFTNANRAMENLAKYLGMFIERKEIVHTKVSSREELDQRIAYLTRVVQEAPPLEDKLRLN